MDSHRVSTDTPPLSTSSSPAPVGNVPPPPSDDELGPRTVVRTKKMKKASAGRNSKTTAPPSSVAAAPHATNNTSDLPSAPPQPPSDNEVRPKIVIRPKRMKKAFTGCQSKSAARPSSLAAAPHATKNPSESPSPPPPPSAEHCSNLQPPPPPPKKKSMTTAELWEIAEAQKKKLEAARAPFKPKYIPKAERERMALEERKQEERKRQQKEVRQLESHAAWLALLQQPSPPDAVPTGPKADRHINAPPTGPAAMRSQNPTGLATPLPPASVALEPVDPGEKERLEYEQRQAELNKKRYLGPGPEVSTFSAAKKRKRNDEEKFKFSWDPNDDTTEYNPPHEDPVEIPDREQYGLISFNDEALLKKAVKLAASIRKNDPENGATRAEAYFEDVKRGVLYRNRRGNSMHWSKKTLAEMQQRDWRIFKEDFHIATKGGGIPNPMRYWTESGLPQALLDIIEQVGYTDPSPVQRAAIPIALQNRDLIGVAVTGSGKTAAFLLPLLVYIAELPRLDESEWRRSNGPYSIILAPTRELAQQIELEARKFAGPLGFTVVSIVGGHSIEEQAYNLRNGAEIIIATPGRLVDCIERRIIVLEQCCYVIMDEADRMIDLGFEEPVNKILDALPVVNEKPDSDAAENPRAMSQYLGNKERYRQTMMYTATMPGALERIARKYLRRPAIVNIGNVGEAVDTVEQRVEFVSGEDKRKKRLGEILLSRTFKPPIIVFVNIKRNCDAVARDIKQMGFSSVTLHGSKTQDQREAALLSLREGRSDVLVATDLAGRGIDVPDVSLVVNFNMATNIEQYTHRVGRTGRAGKTGTAITFLGNEDNDVLYDLKQMLMKSERSRVPEELRKHEAAQSKRSNTGHGGAGQGKKPAWGNGSVGTGGVADGSFGGGGSR